MRILVVVEEAAANYAAYAPDVPGCVATGATREETLERMQVALQMHLRGLQEDGEQLPETHASVEILEVSAAYLRAGLRHPTGPGPGLQVRRTTRARPAAGFQRVA